MLKEVRGGVSIETNNLSLTNGGLIDASTSGLGGAGVVSVTATGDITADGEDSDGFPSGITSLVDFDAEGDSGGVSIETNNLSLTNGGRVAASTFSTGDAGAVSVTATGDITADGESSGGFGSGITSLVDLDAEGDAGGISIQTNNLSLTKGGRVNASTFGNGNASSIDINVAESINISGSIARFRSGISANALSQNGNGGNISVNTGSLTIANGGTIEATNFESIGDDDFAGTGQPGNIVIAANSIELTNSAKIEAATQFEGEQGGIINLEVAENIILKNNSFISAQAFENADGGNLNIDARFMIAFPSNGIGNDLVATAEDGTGGNISLNVEQLFGLSAGQAVNPRTNDFFSNSENDIDVSGNVDGDLNIEITNVDPLQGITELPNNIVEAEQTSVQACRSRRDRTAKSGLSINGKGGVTPDPTLPLSSNNVFANETNSTSSIPAPIETSQGKIQPARGIKVSESGEITLTAYRTNNAGDRIPKVKRNCGQV